jgi:hypothetical protein
MIKISKILNSWLPLAVTITLLCGLSYIVGQQVYRQSANDPQIRMAEDASLALSSGTSPQDIVTKDTVNMATGLSPYLIIFDESGRPLASSVILDGKTPYPPAGVFDYTKIHQQDRITWQPRPSVRHAAVISYFNGRQRGFVLAGRSMREVEIRETNLMLGVTLGWLVTLSVSLAIIFSLELLKAISARRATK